MKNQRWKMKIFQFLYTKPSFDKRVLNMKKSMDQIKKILDGNDGKNKDEKKEEKK